MHLTAVRAPFCVAVFKMERVKGMLTFGRQLTGMVHQKASQLTGRVHQKASQLTGEAKWKATDFACKAKGRVEDAKGKATDLKRSAENKANQVEARIHQNAVYRILQIYGTGRMLWTGVGAAATWVIAVVKRKGDQAKEAVVIKETEEDKRDRRLSLLEKQNLQAQQRITEIEKTLAEAKSKK